MQTNELMIGNYLQELTSNDVFQVEKCFFILLDLNLEISRPIPLTEKWLLDFGFIQDKVDIAFYKNDIQIFLPNYFQYKDSLLPKIKYVHQLQNLYFSLTETHLQLVTQTNG